MKLNRDQRIEITHDILAREVYARISAADKMRLKVAQFIRDRHDYYLEEGVLLGARDLSYIDPYLERVELSEAQRTFIVQSRQDVKQSIRRRRLIIAAVITTLALFSLFALVQWMNAEDAEDRALNSAARTEQANRELGLEKLAALKARDEARRNELIADSLAKEAVQSAFVAQQQRTLALQQKQKAETAEQITRQTLEELEQSNATGVQLLLDDATADILFLKYDDALGKLQAAAALQAMPEAVAEAQLELAFWYTESGQLEAAAKILETVTDLLGRAPSAFSPDQLAGLNNVSKRKVIAGGIHSLAPATYSSLQERYFPVMLPVKGGTFLMGCNDQIAEDCNEDESPAHTVSLADFRMAQTEITFWQFGLFCTATGRQVEDFAPSWGVWGNNPAVNISWLDALAYTHWLNEHLEQQVVYALPDIPRDSRQLEAEGIDWAALPDWNAKGYRLPTEAEWEYAARGGPRQEPFKYSGGADLAEVAWYNDNSGLESGKRSQKVATKQPNALGVYDLSGNVNEWCWDRYAADYYGNSPAEKPRGPDTGDSPVLRGGSWYSFDFNCRIFGRQISAGLGIRNEYVGFRLVSAQ